MSKYTLSYGLLPQELSSESRHLLPISSISHLSDGTVITTGRDGNVIIDKSQSKLTVHSDWISGIACLSPNKFITVSHDFTICYTWLTSIWNHRIIGYHDDYVKGVAVIGLHDMKCRFATIGLDKKLKVWELDLFEVENEDDVEATLLSEFDNTTLQDAGSIYCVVYTNNYLIFGDNDGRLRWYDVDNKALVRSIDDAAAVNLKTLKLVDDNKTVISTSADGEVRFWDVDTGDCINRLNLPHAVWSIEGSSSNHLYLGDSSCNIHQLQNGEIKEIYKNDDKNVSSGGILAMSIIDDEVWFSRSSNSNLNKFNLSTKKLKVINGGHALVRCSLLTNRRHVITENTLGMLEKWDIVSCKRVQRIDTKEGSFDEVVQKMNPKEVLTHWCTVCIKRGILFVKINERCLNTEVYGSALSDYEIVNNDKVEEINDDERYNLGRIAINSLLYGFIEYELQKDKRFREDRANLKKHTPPSTPTILRRHNSAASEQLLTDQHRDVKTSKEKKRLSIFTKFTTSNNTTPQSSGPNTPNGMMEAPIPSQGILEEAEDGMDLMLPAPAATSNISVRPPNLPLSRTMTEHSIERSATPSSTFAFHKALKTKLEAGSTEDLPSVSSTGNADGGIKFHSKYSSSTGALKDSTPKPGLFLNEYIEDIHHGYSKLPSSSSSNFMKFGKRVPETLIVRDSTRPIVKIESACILTVNHWKEGSTGETISFSTYLPPPSYTSQDTVDTHQTYESMERHLPIWLGKILFKEDKVVKNYPKISFIIQPWKDPNQASTSTSNDPDSVSETRISSFYRKSKPADLPFTLPKISDSNVRLTAANMIKAKKIKHFIVERFESRTPEMKNKEDPSEWLEILCKDVVLENDITLSAIRTLYWKSNTDIVLEYRRRIPSTSHT